MKSNLEEVLEDVRKGKPVIIVDQSNREDEADLCLAAEMCNQYNLVFCMNHGGGLMCLPMTKDRLDKLEIPMMPSNGKDPLATPFATSVDCIAGCSTGMSVFDRLKTISVFLDETSKPSELHFPGHLFPLVGKPGLMKDRQGHTESSIELVKLAGFKPMAMIIEMMNDDGTMTKGQQVKAFAATYDLKLITVQEIYEAVYGEKLE